MVEVCNVGEGLMGKVMRLEVVPDHLAIVQFGGIFGQPIDGEPMCRGANAASESLLT